MNPLDPKEFRRQGHMVIDFLADYYESIQKYPVRSQVKPGYLIERLPDSAPLNPEPIETILNDVQTDIIPGITHWQSPNFFAYFASSASTASFLGEMLLNGFNVVGFNWLSSPAATELEMVVMEWLLKLLQLPKSFSFSSDGGGGVLLGTTCEALVCTLLAAKENKLDQVGVEKTDKLVVYCSDQTHFSLHKAAKIVGIKPENVRQIMTTMCMNFQLSPQLLDEFVKRDIEAGLIPMYLCATVGTTSTTAVDPLGPLCEVSNGYDIWVHVDAAYAGSACICPEFRHFLDGVEGASSFSFNAHKWLLTNLSCCCLWVKDKFALMKPLTTDSEYLRRNEASDSRNVVDYKDWQIALTRRFQALKIWMVIRSYGTNGLREFIRKHVKMAKDFEAFVRMDKRFEIVVPRYFSMVCFRVAPNVIRQQCGNDHEANEFNEKLLESVNATGRIYMTQSVVGGIYVIRFAVGATLTEDSHVRKAWELVKDHTTSLLTTVQNVGPDVMKLMSKNGNDPTIQYPGKNLTVQNVGLDVVELMSKIGNDPAVQNVGPDVVNLMSKIGNDPTVQNVGPDVMKLISKNGNDPTVQSPGINLTVQNLGPDVVKPMSKYGNDPTVQSPEINPTVQNVGLVAMKLMSIYGNDPTVQYPEIDIFESYCKL